MKHQCLAFSHPKKIQKTSSEQNLCCNMLQHFGPATQQEPRPQVEEYRKPGAQQPISTSGLSTDRTLDPPWDLNMVGGFVP